ncbi:MAG TPA: hypothetical protein VJ011_10400 [Steroidobacteraceae bacterium]|nr:hypothetical protein [Steroidobacteraceae bacterium]
MRVAVDESPVFLATRHSERAPAVEVLRCCRPQLLAGMGLRFGENVSYYIVTAFSITYITEVAGLGRTVALNGVLAAGVAHALALLRRTGSAAPIAIYLSVTCCVTALAMLLARETRAGRRV